MRNVCNVNKIILLNIMYGIFFPVDPYPELLLFNSEWNELLRIELLDNIVKTLGCLPTVIQDFDYNYEQKVRIFFADF